MKVTQSCLTLRPHGLSSPWNSPGQATGVGSRSFLHGIFPTQVSRIAGGFFTNLIPGLGRSPGEGKGYPLQYSGQENSMDCVIHGSQRVGHDWVTNSDLDVNYGLRGKSCRNGPLSLLLELLLSFPEDSSSSSFDGEELTSSHPVCGSAL